jgi:uncharacterized membrane protein YeaQ/YmgE (transglycosylase-associated protein family)
MNLVVKILAGAVTGWLTGRAVATEGRTKVRRDGQVLDTILGVIGALIGDYLFFWIVIGKGSVVSDFATVILGSITMVGVARLVIEP